jgi:GntR family transcriptional regulator/MocR family aminotransferase
VGLLENGMTSRQAESAAAAQGIDVMALDRFTAKRADPRGILLGFGAFDESTIRTAVARLARALDRRIARTP